MIGGTIITLQHLSYFKTDDGIRHKIPHVKLTVQEEWEGPTETILIHPTNRMIEIGDRIWGNGDFTMISRPGKRRSEFRVPRLRVQFDGKIVSVGG